MIKKLNEIRAGIASWRKAIDEAERELDEKLARLSYLQEAPLPAEEVAKIVIDHLGNTSERLFRSQLADKLRSVITRPLHDHSSNAYPVSLLANVHGNQKNICPHTLFHLLRPSLTKALIAEIKALPELAEAGPPIAARRKEIDVLQTDIEALRKRIQSEREAAKDAGLDLSQGYQRPGAPSRTRDLKRTGRG